MPEKSTVAHRKDKLIKFYNNKTEELSRDFQRAEKQILYES
jgi:hypothetical protein